MGMARRREWIPPCLFDRGCFGWGFDVGCVVAEGTFVVFILWVRRIANRTILGCERSMGAFFFG